MIFEGAPAECLGRAGSGRTLLERLLDRAAVLLACEQTGGARACLEMACAYTRERYAFGRPVASFQAIQHKLANMLIDLEIAQANVAHAVAMLDHARPAQLRLAAAAARLGALDAYEHCSRENIQCHGGMGFTWEFDCHLYYRRAKLLALSLVSRSYWVGRLVKALPDSEAAGLRSGAGPGH